MKFFFAGDVLLKEESYTGSLLSSELQKLVGEHDIVCCNLEGPCIKKGTKEAKKRGPSISQGKHVLQRLRESGFNTLDLANNHIMDYGEEGLINTLKNIKKDFYYCGAAENEESVYKLLEFCINGKRVCFIAVAECAFGSSMDGEGGCAWMAHEEVAKMFRIAKERCDYIFVLCHCGAEELEVPLPEVRKIYRSFIDQGADVVIGHHPHVMQGCEDYNGKYIFYSLGNFAFDSLENSYIPYQPYGLCVSIKISEKNKMYYEPICTEYRNGKVRLCSNDDNWNKVNTYLKNKNVYKKMVDEYCTELFEKYLKKYILNVIGLDIDNKEKLDKFVNYRLSGEPLLWDYLFLYHNIAIETNRWICLHAIKALGYID